MLTPSPRDPNDNPQIKNPGRYTARPEYRMPIHVCWCGAQVNGRFLPAEIALLQRLAHVDGVVHLIDHFEQLDCFLIVMERPTPSEDLFDYITRRGALPEAQARDILRQTITTLTAVHDAGVYHRDIKDENMLIDSETGRIRLIDFGSAAFARNNPYTYFGGMLLDISCF